MKYLSIFFVAIGFIALTAWMPSSANEVEMETANVLSLAEEEAGWEPLFDGQTTEGWRNFKKEGIGPAWKVQNGTLMLDKSDKSVKGGDLVTEAEYENFDFRLEWKISDCGNSGIMFNVTEEGYEKPYHTGPEMQVLDNKCHPDAKIITHRSGDLYDMIKCKKETVKPAGEWNSVRIRIKNGKASFWQNGVKVVKFEMFTPEWNSMIADSKFKSWKGFGQSRKGRLCLQDHSDTVWFRNIKIKEL